MDGWNVSFRCELLVSGAMLVSGFGHLGLEKFFSSTEKKSSRDEIFPRSNLFEANDLSNEKRAPGWLGYIGDYTTQLYWDYNTPL